MLVLVLVFGAVVAVAVAPVVVLGPALVGPAVVDAPVVAVGPTVLVGVPDVEGLVVAPIPSTPVASGPGVSLLLLQATKVRNGRTEATRSLMCVMRL